MSTLLSRLVSESAIYGLGAAASQAVGIILIPLYARQLGTTDYGVLAIFNTTISLSAVLVGLALAQAFLRTYLKDTATLAERRHVLGAAMTLRLAVSVASAAAIALLSEPLAQLLFGSASWRDHMLLVSLIVLLDTVTVLPLSYLRAERRPTVYALLSVTRAVVGSILIVTFVVVAQMGVYGALLGSALAAAVTAAMGFAALIIGGNFTLSSDWSLMRAMLVFSLPLVPAAAASWVLSFIDRYFLQAFEGSSAVGVYAAGYTVGLILNVFVVQPFTLMWSAAKWDIYRDNDDAPRIFARVTTGFVVVASLAALTIAAFATDAIRFLLTPAFEESRYVVPFSAFAAVLYGVYTLVGTGLNIEAKTKWIAASFGVAAAVNIGLNLVLIPAFGFMGAAYATILSYGLLTGLTGLLSHRFYPIPWQLRQMTIAMVVAFALAVGALLGPDIVVWRIACIVAFIPLMLGLRVVSAEDVTTMRRALVSR